jgi:hypothetical protein
MTTIILPTFYDNFVQNDALIEGLSNNTKIGIGGVCGSFPHSYYKNDVNNNFLFDFISYSDMCGCAESYRKVDIFLDFSNPLLEQKDYHSRLSKIHFSTFETYPNVYFLVSQYNFANYILQHYPKAKVIIDLDYCDNDFDMTLENIVGVISWYENKLQDYDYNYKILRVPVYGCRSCNYYEKCLALDVQNAMEFSSVSNFYNCTKKVLLNTESILDTFNKNATHFLMDTPKDSEEEYYNHLIRVFEEGSCND